MPGTQWILMKVYALLTNRDEGGWSSALYAPGIFTDHAQPNRYKS
jgi:hypothetical protein